MGASAWSWEEKSAIPQDLYATSALVGKERSWDMEEVIFFLIGFFIPQSGRNKVFQEQRWKEVIQVSRDPSAI